VTVGPHSENRLRGEADALGEAQVISIVTGDVPDGEDDLAGAGVNLTQRTSVAKALAVIEVFVGGPPTLGVTEVAHRAGLQKSTAFRLLSILVDCQVIERRGERYMLGKRLFEFGHKVIFCRPRGLRDVALPHMVELQRATGATVQLAILDGVEVLYIEKLYGYDSAGSPSQVGERLPASVTALGKAMVAYGEPQFQRNIAEFELAKFTPHSVVDADKFLEEMSQVRAAGYALDRQESKMGLVCIAAPVLVDGRATAAVSLSQPIAKGDPRVHKEVLRQVARRISNGVVLGVR
jgi:IclR family transcriptional regulator, KDG regulon repressor